MKPAVALADLVAECLQQSLGVIARATVRLLQTHRLPHPPSRQGESRSSPARWRRACRIAVAAGHRRESSAGSPSPSCSVKRAPMAASGVVTRRIGRRRSEASPVSVAENRCAASKPSNSLRGCPGVSAEERALRLLEASPSPHRHCRILAKRRYLGSELPQNSGTGLCVERGEGSSDMAGTPGQSAPAAVLDG